jgi:hypothetical protein
VVKLHLLEGKKSADCMRCCLQLNTKRCRGGALAGLEDIFGAPALTPNNGASGDLLGGGSSSSGGGGMGGGLGLYLVERACGCVENTFTY